MATPTGLTTLQHLVSISPAYRLSKDWEPQMLCYKELST